MKNMRKYYKNLASVWIMCIALLGFCAIFFSTKPVYAATPLRQTDVTEPAEGNGFFVVEGTFSSATKEQVLNRINAIRLEACREGVLAPGTGEKLTMDDYVPIKWSSNLEWIAQTRAAEACVAQGHTRTNGTICFTAVHNDVNSWAEDIAWNWSGMMFGIEQWYEEKEDWVNQRENTVTGHYTSMIDPDYKYIGLGAFKLSQGGWTTVVAEFSMETGLDETKIGVMGKYNQILEVPLSAMQLSLPRNIVLTSGSRRSLPLTAMVTLENVYGGKNTVKGSVLNGVTWQSSNPAVISVDQTGKITACNVGTATVSAIYKNIRISINIISRYSVTYYLNGGSNSRSNPSAYYNRTVTLKNPTRRGYIFAGWYRDRTYKSRVRSFSRGNQTVYAKWSKVTTRKVRRLSVRPQRSRKMKVSYSPVKYANGYQLVYSTNKKFKGKTTKVIYTRSRSKLVKKLRKKTYYVRVRAYRYDSTKRKITGRWSSIKKVKIKR
ncbi:MAG: InlB B-repeat-containing protein [Anaerostipes sp.]|uniref:InlB B-repeat-containing protein n=1 Tax=Anaerostipes sp. TaxID=1872530 RepID=UPI003994032F